MSAYTKVIANLVFPAQERLKGHSTVAVRHALQLSQWLTPPQLQALQLQRLEKRLLQGAEQVQPQIMHVRSPVLNALPALRAGRRLGIPVVYPRRAMRLTELVTPLKPLEVMAQGRLLLADKSCWGRLHAQGRHFFDGERNWRQSASRYQAVYRELLVKRQPGLLAV